MQRSRVPSRRDALRFAAVVLTAGLLSLPVVIDGAAATSAHAGKRVVLSAAQNSTYGTILVSGKTVYTLKASKVACTARCLKVWPALLLPKGVKKPTAGAGVKAANLGTVMRRRHVLQVTYSGRPLYWFVGDTGPGQVNGNITDKWGKWSVVVLAQAAASAPPPAAPVPQDTTTTTSPPTRSNSEGSPNGSTSPAASTRGTPAPTTPPQSPATAPPPTTTPAPPPTMPPPTTTPTTTPPPTTTTTAPSGGGVSF